MVFQNNVLAGGAGGSGTTGYTIDQSIRFNDDDSPYMSRTFGTATDANKWTLSAWSKLGNGSGMRFLEAGGSAGSEDFVGFGGSAGYENLYFWKRTSSSYNYNLTSTQQFRDRSAFYHFVYVFDSSNATSSERMKVYVNGQRITNFSTETYPSSGLASRINTAVEHRIGEPVYGGGHSDGYLAELVFIDGQALDPSSFGETNDSGIWIPKDVSGLTFGNNGFHIDGRDSADLGDDESGNGNDFTTSGLAAHDQVLDTPTNNFCTLNPLFGHTYDSNQTRPAQITVTNQIIRYSSGANGFAVGTQVIPPSGKWYYELYTGPSYPALQGLTFGWTIFNEIIAGNKVYTYSYAIGQRHTSSPYSVWYYPATTTNTGLTPFGQGVTIGVAIDFSASTITLTKDGSAYGSKDFDDVSQPMSGYEQYTPYGMQGNDQDATCTFNFGADSTFNGQISAGGNSDANGFGNFKYSVPADHLCLCSRNIGS